MINSITESLTYMYLKNETLFYTTESFVSCVFYASFCTSQYIKNIILFISSRNDTCTETHSLSYSVLPIFKIESDNCINYLRKMVSEYNNKMFFLYLFFIGIILHSDPCRFIVIGNEIVWFKFYQSYNPIWWSWYARDIQG